MIGNRLRALRKDRGWLQQELADRLDITVKHYSQMERNKAHPSMTLLQKIADLFEVEVKSLYDEKIPEMIPEKEPGEAAGLVPFDLPAGKKRGLFKDMAPRLASATVDLLMRLDLLDDGQVDQALQWGMGLVKMAKTIHEEEDHVHEHRLG